MIGLQSLFPFDINLTGNSLRPLRQVFTAFSLERIELLSVVLLMSSILQKHVNCTRLLEGAA